MPQTVRRKPNFVAGAEIDGVDIPMTATEQPATPGGELSGDTTQEQLDELDSRIGSLRRLIEMDSFIEERDYFFGGTTEDGEIGQLGWLADLVATANITLAAAADSGNFGFAIMSVVANADVATISRHIVHMEGSPAFTWACRCKIPVLNNGTNDFTIEIGLGNVKTGTEHTNGYYFRYSSADNTWHFKTADASTRGDTDTNVAASTGWVWFIIQCDGDPSSPMIRAWIEDSLADWDNGNATPVATHSTANTIPDVGDIYGPVFKVIKTAGSGSKGFRVGRYFLRVEHT